MPDIWSYYPRESREAGEEGTAVVVVCYDTKGKVTNSELHSSSGFDRLDDAAIRASRKIRLDPPIRDSVPQAGCGVVPFKFSKKR
jgi:protein TonB